MRIGVAACELGLTPDTLRYYERIRLIPAVHRNPSGARKKMGFSLREIKTLLRFRENPQKAKPGVRKMAYQKLEEIDAQLREIRTLKTELELLINLCHSTDDGCPILERLDNGDGNRVER